MLTFGSYFNSNLDDEDFRRLAKISNINKLFLNGYIYLNSRFINNSLYQSLNGILLSDKAASSSVLIIFEE